MKKTVVVHSGGMDSSICLALAIKLHGAENVLSMSFQYGQRHSLELERAGKICETFGVERTIIPIDCLQKITSNALLDSSIPIEKPPTAQSPNTLVVGRNGLMARIAAIHAHELGATSIYIGIIGVEGQYSGYRDCSRHYMDLMEEILRIDLDNPEFKIETPLVAMTKAQTMQLAHELGILPFLLETTVTCYEGIDGIGCQRCPACLLRNEGVREFLRAHPEVSFSWSFQLQT